MGVDGHFVSKLAGERQTEKDTCSMSAEIGVGFSAARRCRVPYHQARAVRRNDYAYNCCTRVCHNFARLYRMAGNLAYSFPVGSTLSRRSWGLFVFQHWCTNISITNNHSRYMLCLKYCYENCERWNRFLCIWAKIVYGSEMVLEKSLRFHIVCEQTNFRGWKISSIISWANINCGSNHFTMKFCTFLKGASYFVIDIQKLSSKTPFLM